LWDRPQLLIALDGMLGDTIKSLSLNAGNNSTPSKG
jgi:hypothetical protein